MTRTRRLRWSRFIVLFFGLTWAGIWAADQVRSMRDRSVVAELKRKMRTICVGRLLIDIPAEAQVNLPDARIGGFEVETIKESDAEFQKRVLLRQNDINDRSPAFDGTGGMVKARELHADGVVGRIFAFGVNRDYTMNGDRKVTIEYFSVEAHGRSNGLSVILSADYADESMVGLAEALLTRFRPRGESEIPAELGFCVASAIFVEPSAPHKNENITMFVALPRYPDVGIALFSIANAKPGPTLLARVADIDAAADVEEVLRTTKLRSAGRAINGMAGEELAERFREPNFTTGYSLQWETRGIQGDLLRPYLSLEMQAGASPKAGSAPVDARLHKDAVLALWDSVSSSIRVRTINPQPRALASQPEDRTTGTVMQATRVQAPSPGTINPPPAS